MDTKPENRIIEKKNDKETKNDEKNSPLKKGLRFFTSFGTVFWVIFGSLSLFFFTALVIVLTLTKSEALVSVPLIKHQYLVDVYNNIIEKGLKIEIELADIPELSKGYIISQTPPPGVLVRPGHKLKLKISRGIQFCETPNLIGVPMKSLTGILDSIQVGGKKAELKVGQIAYVPSQTEQADIILDQIPKPKERIQIKSYIHILVSKGKIQHSFRMANYINQDIDLLYETFAIRGITIQYNIEYIKDKQKHGRVLSQSPRSGKALKKDKTVAFTVGLFKEDLYHRVGYEVIEYKVLPADNDRVIEVFIKDNYTKRSRFKKKVQKGENIKTILRREGDAEITIESEGKVLKKIQIKESTER